MVNLQSHSVCWWWGANVYAKKQNKTKNSLLLKSDHGRKGASVQNPYKIPKWDIGNLQKFIYLFIYWYKTGMRQEQKPAPSYPAEQGQDMGWNFGSLKWNKSSTILDALLGSHMKINCLSLETPLRNQLVHDVGAVITKAPLARSSAGSEAQWKKQVLKSYYSGPGLKKIPGNPSARDVLFW